MLWLGSSEGQEGMHDVCLDFQGPLETRQDLLLSLV